MSKRIFITGATGFVGSHVVRASVAKGYEVHILCRQETSLWRIADITSRLWIHRGDITDYISLKKIITTVRPSVIFHFANAGVYGGKHAPESEVISANFIGSCNLLQACNDIDYECFVNTGSSSEYGKKKSPMKETDSCFPTTMYGITKLASTLYAANIARDNHKPIVNLRLFSPFGPYDHHLRLIPWAIRTALKGDDLMLANPNAARDYIFIEDVAPSYLMLIERAGKCAGETLNLGSGNQKKVSDVIQKIIAYTGSKSKVVWNAVPGRDFDSEYWEADMQKTAKILGMAAGVSFEEGLQKTIRWFREHAALYDAPE